MFEKRAEACFHTETLKILYGHTCPRGNNWQQYRYKYSLCCWKQYICTVIYNVAESITDLIIHNFVGNITDTIIYDVAGNNTGTYTHNVAGNIADTTIHDVAGNNSIITTIHDIARNTGLKKKYKHRVE